MEHKIGHCRVVQLGEDMPLAYFGTHKHHKGGAANYLCLPNDPDHLQYQSGVQGYSYVSGVEYWYAGFPLLSSLNSHHVPCAVCYVATRSVAVMVPAKTLCPTDWTVEYVGYLMAEHQKHMWTGTGACWQSQEVV